MNRDKNQKFIEELAQHGTSSLSDQIFYAFLYGSIWSTQLAALVLGLFYLGAWGYGLADPWRMARWFCLPGLALYWVTKMSRIFFERRRDAGTAQQVLELQKSIRRAP